MPELRIVVADSCADLRSTLAALLNAEPDMHCVATASTAGETLNALTSCRPDALVIDVALGDGSGIPLIAALRHGAPAMAIVVYTGCTQKALVHECIRAGADAVLAKPSDIDAITGALRRVPGATPIAIGATTGPASPPAATSGGGL